MLCPECRESGRFPWRHRAGCTEALKQQLRLYEFGFAAMLVVVIVETGLLLFAYRLLGAWS